LPFEILHGDWDMNQRVDWKIVPAVSVDALLAEALAVITEHEDQRVTPAAVSFQTLEKRCQLAVDVTDYLGVIVLQEGDVLVARSPILEPRVDCSHLLVAIRDVEVAV
jgi:hypothetical protein